MNPTVLRTLLSIATDRGDLAAALQAAITEVMDNKRTALLDIRVA